MFNIITALLVPALLWIVTPALSGAYGQSGDYGRRPLQEVEYSQLEVRLEIGFESRAIRGVAAYSFQPKHAYVDRIIWQAREIDIESVSLDGEEITYQIESDSLFISFDEYLEEIETREIRISYIAEPSYGVHFKPNGTVFSSNMPGSVSHWLPGPVHPRASMPVSIGIEVPEEFTAVSSGDLELQTATDRGSRYIRESAKPVSISELGFAVGMFELSETFSGTKSFGIYHEVDTYTEEEIRELLEHLVDRTRELERLLRSELPVNSFHAILLNDNRWESRSYGVGMAYLFKNQHDSNIKTQLDRSVSAQWFGIALRPEQWQNFHFIVLLQAAIAEEINVPDWKPYDKPLREAFEVPETVYSMASMEYWQWARAYIRNDEAPVLSTALRESMQELSTRNITWTNRDFSSYLYEKTGRWMEMPELRRPVSEPAFHYRVHIEEVRGSDQFTLEFIPEANLTEDLHSVTVNWIQDGRIYESEYEFDGSGDTLEVNPEGRISNLWIEQNNDTGLSFTEEKPFSMWLYQFRRDDDADRRKIAAEALRDFADDPDLQLALQDRVGREENVSVLAAIYRVLSDITEGASGTERRFLEGVYSSHPEIRMVSMEALRVYSENQQVKEEVLNIIQTSEDIDLVNKAISTYRHLLNDEDFRDFVMRFLREDRQDQLFTQTLLQELFEIPVTDATVEMATEYLSDGYSFEIRWLSYRLLRSHAGDADWQQDFVDAYFDDPDPRIRFLTLFSLFEIDSQERRLFLEERMLQEYDIRILRRVKEMLTAE